MANVRIKDLTTTAATTASDDFFGVDGTTNGTRKLNAYSPTFGGNLTVSGTGTSSVAGPFGMGTASPTSFGAGYGIAELYNATNGPYFLVNNGTALVQFAVPTSTNRLELGTRTNHNILIVRNNSEVARFDASTTTLAGNLTVTGGTIGTAASTNLTLAGGSSGASLVLGQGTNGAATLTSNGSGRTTFTTPRTNTFGQLFTNSGTVAANDRVGFLFGFGGLYTNSGIAAQILDNGSTGAEDVVIYTGTNATGAGEAARFKNTGNFLIGTTTDGGQKLQVNGTIAIGANVWHTSLSDSKNRFYFIGNGASNYSGAGTGDNHVFQNSAGSTILALDNSLNATFAKKIGIGGTAPTNGFLEITGDGATGTRALYIQGGAAFPTANSILRIDAAGGTAFQVFGSGNVNVLGAIAIGNTVQTAVGVASTHKVTISIGGSTYYLLATNV